MFSYDIDKNGDIYCLDTDKVCISRNNQKNLGKMNTFGFDFTSEKEVELYGKRCVEGIYKLQGEFINDQVSVFLDNNFHVVAIYSLLQETFIPMLTKEQAKKLLGDDAAIDEISLLKSTVKLKCQAFLDKENYQKQKVLRKGKEDYLLKKRKQKSK